MFGQVSGLCGQVSQVDEWGCHSAGMRKPEEEGWADLLFESGNVDLFKIIEKFAQFLIMIDTAVA